MENDVMFIGLDLGTTGYKAAGVLGGSLFACASATAEYWNDGPRREFDPNRACDLIMELIAQVAGSLPEGAVCGGICISSAAGNTILVDGQGHPLAPGIGWQDSRQVGQEDDVAGDMSPDEMYRLVGWPYSGRMVLGQLTWLKHNQPQLLAMADRVCMTADFINFNLTGQWLLDRSAATTTYMQDQMRGCWHRPFLERLGLDERQLPPLAESGSLVGRLTAKAAQRTGLPEGTPVFLGSFDHPSAARAVGVLRPGQLLLSCGTSWVCLVPWEDREKILELRMLCDPFLAQNGPWAGMKSLSGIALHLDRVKNHLVGAEKNRHDAFDALAKSAPPGAGGLLVNPMLLGETEAELASWAAGQAPAQLARAVVEGAAYLLRGHVEGIEAGGIQISSVSMVGGAAAGNLWPQIISDVLNKPIKTPEGLYAGAVGAAIMAAVSAGACGSIEQAAALLAGRAALYTPDPANAKIYQEGYRNFRRRFFEG